MRICFRFRFPLYFHFRFPFYFHFLAALLLILHENEMHQISRQTSGKSCFPSCVAGVFRFSPFRALGGLWHCGIVALC